MSAFRMSDDYHCRSNIRLYFQIHVVNVTVHASSQRLILNINMKASYNITTSQIWNSLWRRFIPTDSLCNPVGNGSKILLQHVQLNVKMQLLSFDIAVKVDRNGRLMRKYTAMKKCCQREHTSLQLLGIAWLDYLSVTKILFSKCDFRWA